MVQRSGWRRWLFRLGALALGFACLAIVEITCVVCGWDGGDFEHDPFVGFEATSPLFELDATSDHYQIARTRTEFFRPDSFPRQKGPSTYRVFCLGGSTVQGRPFAIETSFTTWLELALQAAEANVAWEVINCGGVSYASYRLVPILTEILGYDPDLVIVYTGHNEFLEDRSYRHIQSRPQAVRWAYRGAFSLRSYRLLHARYQRWLRTDQGSDAPRPPVLAAEVSALLDYRGGLEAYHRDETWRRDVLAHFQFNLRRMGHLCQRAGIPMLLINPVSNLRDCPPFKSEHRTDLTEAQRRQWEQLCSQAREHFASDKRRAIELLQAAIAIDDQYAGTFYTLAKCYDDLGMTERAHESYVRAKELDVCPLRILESMHDMVLETARRTGVTYFDARRLFEQQSSDGIPGADLLIDHVHPTIHGHQMIADGLIHQLANLDIVRPSAGWEARRDQLFRDHLASLDDHYFLKAEERLRGLRGWAEGRAEQLHPSSGSGTHGDGDE